MKEKSRRCGTARWSRLRKATIGPMPRHGHEPAQHAPPVDPEQVVGLRELADAPHQLLLDVGRLLGHERVADRGFDRASPAAQVEHREPVLDVGGVRDHSVVQRCEPVAPAQVGGRAPAGEAFVHRQRHHESRQRVVVDEHVGGSGAHVHLDRDEAGRAARARELPQRRHRRRHDAHRRPARDLPSHLQVSGEALVVGGVEHQRDAFVLELLDAEPREAAEDAATLEVGIGRRVHGAHGAEVALVAA